MESLDGLLEHFRRIEKLTATIDPVKCCHKGCSRTFTNQRYFVRHFLKEHSVQNVPNITENEEMDIVSDELGPKLSSCLNTSVNVLCPTLVSQSQEDFEGGCSFDTSVSSDDLKEALGQKVFAFCSSLYSSPGIPLAHAQQTIKSTINLVECINSAYKQNLLNESANVSEETVPNIVSSMKEMTTFDRRRSFE